PGRLASGDDKGAVRVWSLAEKRLLRTLRQPSDVYGVVVGAGWIAAFGDGPVATVWDLETGAVRAQLAGHAFGSDIGAAAGDLLVTTDESGGTFVWDPLTGERLQALPNEGMINGLGQRGNRIVVYGTQRMRVWDVARDRVVRAVPGHTARVRDLAWSADGKVLWSASHDGSARGFDLATGATTVIGTADFTEPPIVAMPPPTALNPHGLRSLRLSPDGKVIATAAEDGTLALTEIATKREIRLVGHTGRVRRIVFSPDQRSAYSVGDTTLRAWDLSTGAQRAYVDLGAAGWDVALVGDDVVATQDEAEPNRVALWRASDLKPVAMPQVATRFAELSSAAGHVIAGTALDLQVLDAAGRTTAKIAYASPATASIAGERLAVTGAGGDFSLFRYPSLELIRSWNGGVLQSVLRLRPDAQLLASLGGKTVRLWDPRTARLLAELELPVLLSQLAWSPDGSRLAIAGGAGTLWIWDLATAARGDLAAYVTCVSPWRLEDTLLVAAPFDPASCAVLSATR
ncbi:MAG: hypothetical protein JNL83_33870, partial [Myxococcales bacterium]|nr:hypothetical protein [Myxococcales bacterium]